MKAIRIFFVLKRTRKEALGETEDDMQSDFEVTMLVAALGLSLSCAFVGLMLRYI